VFIFIVMYLTQHDKIIEFKVFMDFSFYFIRSDLFVNDILLINL